MSVTIQEGSLFVTKRSRKREEGIEIILTSALDEIEHVENAIWTATECGPPFQAVATGVAVQGINAARRIRLLVETEFISKNSGLWIC